MLPKVELVSTGSELLNGRTINRHAHVLGEHLVPMGLALLRDTTVPDDRREILGAIRDALTRVDIVIVSGGLGPTSDDVTRDAVAELLGRRVVPDEASLRHLRQRYAALGRDVTPAAERQALIVEGAEALANQVGLAPGECLEVGDKVLFVLPGPPREFLSVLTEHVIPWLRHWLGAIEPPEDHVFLVTGLSESSLVTSFEQAGFPPAGVDVAFCAAPARVEVRLVRTSSAVNFKETVATARKLLGSHIFAEERIELQEAVARLLIGRKAMLSVAESCTGGLLAEKLTSVSGSSAYFTGGIVAYSNEVKCRDLGVDRRLLERSGAVSEEVAAHMATGARARFGTDYALAVTGIAGPSGGTAEKPVGLVYIALADAAGLTAQGHHFPGDRAWVREWSCLTALDLLRRRMMGIV